MLSVGSGFVCVVVLVAAAALSRSQRLATFDSWTTSSTNPPPLHVCMYSRDTGRVPGWKVMNGGGGGDGGGEGRRRGGGGGAEGSIDWGGQLQCEPRPRRARANDAS